MRCHAVATTGYANAEHIVILQAALFERFKESNDDYLTQARIIIFGLKENAAMRDRLFSGALHCLEFAYADDAVRSDVLLVGGGLSRFMLILLLFVLLSFFVKRSSDRTLQVKTVR